MYRFIFALSLFLIPLFAIPQNNLKPFKAITEHQERLSSKPKICLNMIVKNESLVITRCLDSIKSMIDYWVILDTGSTDGTQEIIKAYLKDIPGELHESPWKNFGESRSEAFNLAKGKGDYILFMDADDILVFEKDFRLETLTEDLYNMWRGTKEFCYIKPQLAKGNLPWKWVGVTHEYLDCGEPYTSAILENVRYECGDGGHRSQGNGKFLNNIELLTEGLKNEPQNERYAFYLAESYRDAGQKGNALEWFQKRVLMGGWPEEVFWSKLQIGHLMRDLQFPSNLVITSYQLAHIYRPHRVEPIYYLVEYLINQGSHAMAYDLIKSRESLPTPIFRDTLFNEDWIEQYGMLFQLSICSYYVGNYQESLDVCDKLLTLENLPKYWRALVQNNRQFPISQLQTITPLIAVQNP